MNIKQYILILVLALLATLTYFSVFKPAIQGLAEDTGKMIESAGGARR